ncbi:MAG: peptide chain release factor 1 [Polyangia bacterium]
MFDKLQSVETRFVELEHRLADPDVINKRAEFQKLSKEHADLSDLVAAFRRYKLVQAERAENRSLLEEKDADMRAMAREEENRLAAEESALGEEMQILLLPKDPNDDKNIMLEVRGGTGGDEAALFAADLFRMYARYAERKRWKVDIMSTSESGAGGFKEVIAMISAPQGGKVFSQLKYESGVHRVQRVPATETQGRIHTSAATVVVLPEVEDVDVKIEDKDLEIKVSRSGGPGGQSVNTTDSAVQVLHKPSGIQVRCTQEKSQHKNKDMAMKILRAKLFEIEEEKREASERELRREQVKSGDRSDKIRTYNFPQDRMTDHRIGYTRHNLDMLLAGDLDPVIDALRTHFQAEAMKGHDA